MFGKSEAVTLPTGHGSTNKSMSGWGSQIQFLFWTPGENFKVLVNNYKNLQQIAWQVTFFCPKTLKNGLKFKESPYFSILPRISHNFREGGGGSPPDPKILGP